MRPEGSQLARQPNLGQTPFLDADYGRRRWGIGDAGQWALVIDSTSAPAVRSTSALFFVNYDLRRPVGRSQPRSPESLPT
ncbi:MAG: hypothetical protein QOE83_22 [Actinomycetota bacterium]|nr:hypothetical protein [Actinomycetota bacterium]